MILVTLSEKKDNKECDLAYTKIDQPPYSNADEKGAFNRAKDLWLQYKDHWVQCNVYGQGKPPSLVTMQKYDVKAELYDDTGVNWIRTLWWNGEVRGSAITKTNADDVTVPSVLSNQGPSALQVAGAVALASAVAFGTWKITDAMMDKRPSRRPAMNPVTAGKAQIDTSKYSDIRAVGKAVSKTGLVEYWYQSRNGAKAVYNSRKNSPSVARQKFRYALRNEANMRDANSLIDILDAAVLSPTENPTNMSDTERARKIVKLAAKKTKIKSVKHWLEFDERGVWEKEARHLIEKTSEKAKTAGWNDEAVDDQIADYLVFLALEATLKDAKKRGKK